MTTGRNASAVWLKRQVSLGRQAALPAILCGFATMPAAIGQAWIMAAIVGAALQSRRPAGLPLLLAGFAVCAVWRAGFGLAADRCAEAAGVAGRQRLRAELLNRLIAVGPGSLRGRHSGELTALAIDRIEALEGLFARWIPASFLALAAPCGVVLAAFLADPFAAWVLIGAGVVVPLGMAASGLGAAAASRRQFVAMARLQTRFLDRIRGIATIVLAGRAEAEAQALGQAAAELRRRTLRVLRVAFLSASVLDCALAGALVVLAVHYAAAWRAGGVPHPARALFALLLVPEFFAPLRTYASAYQDRFQGRAAAEAFAALPAPPPAPDGNRPPIRTVQAHGITVAFENVCLTWDPARGPALTDVSFRVPAGETLIVVGPSGSGKSSLIELLLGFVQPDSGSITVNGAPLVSVVPRALAAMTAWISQRPLLFGATLRENILFGRPDATAAELQEAVTLARLGPLLETLPHGLETMLGEGGYGLSGGQAQRVAIARAFLRRAPLLLLDEPTAHLDPATEAEVLDSLRRLAIGRTVILATHSAAAQRFPGRRLDLRHGQVVARAARGVA